MATPYRIKHLVEYALFCFWGILFRFIPYRIALLLGWVLAWTGHFIVRYRVSLVYGRIREVFPELSLREVRRIAWLSWRNFVFNLVDMFRLDLINEKWLEHHIIDYDTTRERLKELLPEGGLIGVSLHMSSAEVLAVCLQRLGLDVFVITGRQKNLLVDEKLNAMRGATGIDCIPKSASLGMFKQVFRRLRSGGMLTMLVDLRQPNGGIDVPFLGGRASVVPGMGLFAKKAGVPVIPSVFSRQGWTRHHLQILPPIYPDSGLGVDEDVQRMVQMVFHDFDLAVRRLPEQWFWYNKNWILAPLRSPEREKG